MRKAILAFVVVALVAFSVVVFVPLDHIESAERMAVGEMILCSAPVRGDIEAAMLTQKPMPTVSGAHCTEGITYSVDSNELLVSSSKYSIELLFQAAIEDEQVIWKCSGKPLKYVPNTCRGNT
ncbi:MAG: hypothetical protein DHS20C11_06380 [Lysobacteraceae bacterium]|nr:MAG: hypothetical protein DHS20C11_06380 [Xanthomonadaceae bacterium]